MKYLFIFIVLLTACSNVDESANDTEMPEEKVEDEEPAENDESSNNSEVNEDETLAETKQETEEPLVAETSVGNITETEFVNVLKEMYGEETLQLLINEKVFAAEAERLGITETEIASEISFLMDTMGMENNDEFYQAMEMQGVRSESELRERILEHLVMEELTGSSTDIEEEVLLEEYEKGQEVEARHILVGDEETAEDLIARLNEGEDFAELAENYSQDPGSSEEGGHLGFFRRGTMTPPFEEAAFTLEEGEYSNPVESQFGFHIIEVLDRIPFDDPYVEVSEQLYTSVNERKMYEMNRQKEELLENTEIIIHDETLQGFSFE